MLATSMFPHCQPNRKCTQRTNCEHGAAMSQASFLVSQPVQLRFCLVSRSGAGCGGMTQISRKRMRSMGETSLDSMSFSRELCSSADNCFHSSIIASVRLVGIRPSRTTAFTQPTRCCNRPANLPVFYRSIPIANCGADNRVALAKDH